MLREDIHFKHNYYVYLTKHFETGVIEMWCRSSKSVYEEIGKQFFLGTYVLNVWNQPKSLGTLDWGMQKGAQRLHEVCMRKYSKEDESKSEKAKIPVVYDRAYFVEQGKLGQKKVRETYKKPPVALRWAKKKLSP